jgi:hypothetical protein
MLGLQHGGIHSSRVDFAFAALLTLHPAFADHPFGIVGDPLHTDEWKILVAIS